MKDAGGEMPEIDLAELARSLYARRHEAVTAPFEVRPMVGDPLQAHKCHNNVDRWVAQNPGHKAVRGRMVFDWNSTSQRWWPVCQFSAHSLVEDPDGRLVDITPSKASQRYPFIPHDGPDEQFQAIVLAGHTQPQLVLDSESDRAALLHLYDQASLCIRPPRIGLTLFRASRF
jgi:hypothetical protein